MFCWKLGGMFVYTLVWLKLNMNGVNSLKIARTLTKVV